MKTAQEYFNSGLANEESQQFESAIEYYTEAIKLDPKNADYFNQRGISKYKLKDYKGALEDYDKAIELNPNVGKIYGNRGSAKNDLGDKVGAFADLDIRIKLMKDSKKQEFLNSISTVLEDKDNQKSEREIILAAVTKHGSALEHTTKELKSDREIVLAAVLNYGRALKYAADELKFDREIVLAAITSKDSVRAFEYAADNMKSDFEIVLAAVSNYGSALEHTTNELKSNREIVLAAVTNNGQALEYASDELKGDQEIVLIAVTKSRWTLEFASEELKRNLKIVHAAVTFDGSAIEYAADELKSDREIVLSAVTNDGSALKYAGEGLKSDREIVLAAVSNNGYALQFAGDELKSDRKFIIDAVSKNGWALQYVANLLKSDREIVLAAVSNNGYALQFAGDEFKSDREIVLAAVKNNGRALKYATEELKSDDDIVFAAIIEKSLPKNYTNDKLMQNFKIETKNDLYGIVNKATNVNVVDYLYDYVSIVKHHHDLSLINNSCIYLLETGKSNLAQICYYNEQTQNISISKNQFYSNSIKFFYNSKAICANENGWFVVDLNGEVIIGPENSAEDMADSNNFIDPALVRCFDIYSNTNGLGINYGFAPNNTLYGTNIQGNSLYMLPTDEESDLFNADISPLHDQNSNIWFADYIAITSFEYETGTCLIKGRNGKVALMNRYFHRITDWFDEFYEREKFTSEQDISLEDWNKFYFRKGDERYIFKVTGNFVEDIIKRPFVFFEYPDVAERIIENDMFKYNTENIDSKNYLKYDKNILDNTISNLKSENPEVEITNELITEIKQSESFIEEISNSMQLLNSNEDNDLTVIDEKIKNHNHVFGIIPSTIELLSIEKL